MGAEDGRASRFGWRVIRLQSAAFSAIIGGKATPQVTRGERLIIETPGGGGWHNPQGVR